MTEIRIFTFYISYDRMLALDVFYDELLDASEYTSPTEKRLKQIAIIGENIYYNHSFSNQTDALDEALYTITFSFTEVGQKN
jgi:hypothetical protein